MAGSSYTGPHGPQFLHDQIKSLLAFYDPICRDDELGGFHNQLRDDGTGNPNPDPTPNTMTYLRILYTALTRNCDQCTIRDGSTASALLASLSTILLPLFSTMKASTRTSSPTGYPF